MAGNIIFQENKDENLNLKENINFSNSRAFLSIKNSSNLSGCKRLIKMFHEGNIFAKYTVGLFLKRKPLSEYLYIRMHFYAHYFK